MSELHHDRLLADRQTARHTVPTQRTGVAHPSGTTTPEQPRLPEVADLADLTGQAEATARAGIEDVAGEFRPVAAARLLTGVRRDRRRSGPP
ncbi:MAG TPA: hypothetical protein VER39_18070, partial [Nocardioidaceae bacterium]|nr:hypothetical protein [Nocardioidaceae bacterium]